MCVHIYGTGMYACVLTVHVCQINFSKDRRKLNCYWLILEKECLRCICAVSN